MRKSCTTHYAFKPRLIALKHPSGRYGNFSFVPIKSNRILLLAQHELYSHLSIHEIRSDNRVGSALWSFNNGVDSCLNIPNISNLEIKKSTENAWEITLEAQFYDHWKLFNISSSSTTETDAFNNVTLIESGRLDYVPKPNLENPWRETAPRLGLSEILMQSC